MKVVHLITDLNVGGAEVTLARLLEQLDRRRVQSTVISLGNPGPVGDRIERAGTQVYALGFRPQRLNLLALRRLVSLLRRIAPDVLQTWLYHSDLVGLIAAPFAGNLKVVWNVRCAELDPRDHPRSLTTLLRLLAFASRRPSAVICNSDAGRRAHEALGYTPRRWIVIPNGFDVEAFRPRPEARLDLRRSMGAPASAPVVGLLARFHPMKDHETFLRAAQAVVGKRPDVHVAAAGRDVAGNGALVGLIRELGLADRAHLLPEQGDPARFLAGLDVAVSSSYSEAFPNAVGEAMACGIPCVATDVGDAAELVGAAGILIPARDPNALADGILRLLALEGTSREALGRSARARIAESFSLERLAAAYETAYREITGQRPAMTKEPLCAE